MFHFLFFLIFLKYCTFKIGNTLTNKICSLIKVVKQEPNVSNRGRDIRGRGRGRGRGGRLRGGRVLNATGALSAPVMISDNRIRGSASSTPMFTGSPTPDYIKHLITKSEAGSPKADDDDSDSDEVQNSTRVNMQKAQFAGEAEFFPLLPERNDKTPQELAAKLEEQLSMADTTDDIIIKDDPEKENNGLEALIKEKSKAPEPVLIDLDESEQERIREALDYRTISDLVKNRIPSPANPIETEAGSEAEPPQDPNAEALSRLLFIQTPPILPKVEKTADQIQSGEELSRFKSIQGRIGKLRVHRSGKVSIVIGEVLMDVSLGSGKDFLQDVVYMDPKEEKRAYLLGQLNEKLVITPNVANIVS